MPGGPAPGVHSSPGNWARGGVARAGRRTCGSGGSGPHDDPGQVYNREAKLRSTPVAAVVTENLKRCEFCQLPFRHSHQAPDPAVRLQLLRAGAPARAPLLGARAMTTGCGTAVEQSPNLRRVHARAESPKGEEFESVAPEDARNQARFAGHTVTEVAL
jgi:hypothetical protein